ncbi:flavoprotein-like protein [Cunninghamella echinulata]|nr:flavoprotein-like protein [Cunninghamella echinulata]
MNIGVIIGSTRPNRIGKHITQLFLNTITHQHNLSFEIIDLKEWQLPLMNEPGIPSVDDYIHDLTKQWSDKINSKQGFIFITPQYNWGYPASLKNALDYLFKEWKDKPAIIVSYAHRGGGKAALQLKQVLQGLHMKPVDTMPAIYLNDVPDETESHQADVDGTKKLHAYIDVINRSIIELENNLLEKK